MVFCPKCGASLKAESQSGQGGDWWQQRRMWRDQRRAARNQYRAQVWEEKYGDREYGFIGPLVGGLILIVLGFVFYLAVTSSLNWQAAGAIFFVFLGLVVLVGGLFAYSMRKRYWKTGAT
jgi:hypothetical protein